MKLTPLSTAHLSFLSIHYLRFNFFASQILIPARPRYSFDCSLFIRLAVRQLTSSNQRCPLHLILTLKTSGFKTNLQYLKYSWRNFDLNSFLYLLPDILRLPLLMSLKFLPAKTANSLSHVTSMETHTNILPSSVLLLNISNRNHEPFLMTTCAPPISFLIFTMNLRNGQQLLSLFSDLFCKTIQQF